MKEDKKIYFIGILIILLTIFIYYSEKNKIPYYSSYRYLYFLPIIFSSFFYGINGGLQTSLLISSLYIPILVLNIHKKGLIPYNLEMLITVFLFNTVAALFGYLADLEKKQRKISEEIIKFAGCGIILGDKDGNIKFLNEQAKNILKLEKGKSSEDLKSLFTHIIEEVKNKKYTNFEFNLERGNENIPILFNASLLFEGENIIIFCQDLSEKRKLITLEEINRLKSEFISTVSHELKSPLTVIKGFISTLMTKKEEDKSVEEYYQIIDSETERLIRLINDLLCIPRIEEEEGLKFQIESIEIHPLIKKVVDFQRIFTDRHKFIINVEKENIKVLADRDKLEQILHNLLENAVKYSPEGGKITISVSKKDNLIITSVEDEGIGIPENEINKIFEKYYRANIEKTEIIQGAGIGLYLVKKLLEGQNGEIWVKSELGKGSKFFFSLPAGEENS
jgi:two-component system phosphate regulon sensor histidine kinase PhoR